MRCVWWGQTKQEEMLAGCRVSHVVGCCALDTVVFLSRYLVDACGTRLSVRVSQVRDPYQQTASTGRSHMPAVHV